MASELFRWQAGMGAIVGALVSDAVANDTDRWTPAAMRSIDHGEALLAGAPVPMELACPVAVPAAIGLSQMGSPLLMDSATAELVDVLRDGLDHDVIAAPTRPLLAKAFDLARDSTFDDAVAAAGGDSELTPLVGALVGLRAGLGGVPGRYVSTFRAPDGSRGRRYLRGLTNRLLGIELPNWYDPRRRRGPKEVVPGLWMSNLYGLSQFVTTHPDGLVLSLCDDEGRLANHPYQVTFHLEDTPRAKANPSLELVADEVLSEIAAARAVGQPVLVHCRHGASRTGLILRLLLVAEQSLSAEEALIEAQCLWSHTSEWNQEWNREIERRAGS